MTERTVIPLTPDAEVNKAMHDNLVRVLAQVDAGELSGLCIVTVDRGQNVESYKVGEHRFTFAGALFAALVRMVD